MKGAYSLFVVSRQRFGDGAGIDPVHAKSEGPEMPTFAIFAASREPSGPAAIRFTRSREIPVTIGDARRSLKLCEKSPIFVIYHRAKTAPGAFKIQ
jgi:hypothetical protein